MAHWHDSCLSWRGQSYPGGIIVIRTHGFVCVRWRVSWVWAIDVEFNIWKSIIGERQKNELKKKIKSPQFYQVRGWFCGRSAGITALGVITLIAIGCIGCFREGVFDGKKGTFEFRYGCFYIFENIVGQLTDIDPSSLKPKKFMMPISYKQNLILSFCRYMIVKLKYNLKL